MRCLSSLFAAFICLRFSYRNYINRTFYIFCIFLNWDGDPGQSFRMDLPDSTLFILKDPNLTFHLKDSNIF